MIFKGTAVSEFKTVAEKLTAAGLDFTCEKKEAYFKIDDNYQVVKNQFHIMRTDTNEIISSKTVSDDYRIMQNISAFQWLDSLDEISHGDITNAGSFGNGALVYLTVKRKLTDILPDGSVLHFYVVFTNGHIGNKALVAKPITVRKTADSEIILGSGATDNKLERGVRHTKNMSISLADGRAAFNAFNGKSKEFVATAKLLNDAKFSDEQQVTTFFNKIFNSVDLSEDSRKKTITDSRNDKLLEMYKAAGGSTVWNAYLSVCKFVTCDRQTRRQSEQESPEVKRLESTLYGANGKTLTIALLESCKYI